MPKVPEWLNWIGGILSLVAVASYAWRRLVALRGYLSRAAPATEGTHPRAYIKGALLAFICAVIWAMSYASLSMVRKTATEVQTSIYLFAFATAFLYLGSFFANWRKAEPVTTAPAWTKGRVPILVIANIGNFFFSVLALSYITASQAMTFNNLSPVLVAFFLWLRGRLRVSISTIVALVLVVIGAFLVNAGDGFVFRTGDALTGMIVAILAGGCFALWGILMEEIEEQLPSGVARFRLLAIVFFCSYSFAITVGYFRGSQPIYSPKDLFILAANGLRIAVVYFLFQLAIRHARALIPAVVAVLTVPLTLPFDHWLNGAPITPQLIIGAALVVLAAMGLLSDEIRLARLTSTDVPIAKPVPLNDVPQPG